ncbi:hypothetical protein DH2020_039102 [Rehmannia glutinosa]|uniref:NB-ARC domain-containing protein n=1 Tax=Rehmannia glutinosa TaxID=99300 RepID=A0ABR0UXV7_REHGL
MERSRKPPVLLESRPLESCEEFDSRRLTENKIIASLKEENINTIGICGIGGIGKTRMARRIGEKVKREKLFKVVVMVSVGPSSDIKRVVYEMSEYLGVRLRTGDFLATANALFSKLIMEESILIILDDVWEGLDLEIIGILLQKHKGSGNMEFLREKVGSSIDSSDLHPLAISVVEECRGLPLALSLVGGLLKDKSIDVERKNLNPGLSYRSELLQKLGSRDSFPHERKVGDVLGADAISVSLPYSLPQTFETGTNLLEQGSERSQTSLQSSIVSLPPKRGKIKSQILTDLISHLDTEIKVLKMKKVINHKLSSLASLDLRDTNIEVLPGFMKKLINLRLLNLTNCRKLQIIEPGVISSLLRLEELYMLGSFSAWEVEKEGKILGNASINELEFLRDLSALQIQIQDPNIIPKNSRIWSRLTLYVISTPEELKCRFQETLHLSFPAVYPNDYYWQFRRAMDVDLPRHTSFADWLCVMLRSTEYLRLAGHGSQNAVDELIPEGFKLLKQLQIGHCSKMEYLVDGTHQVLPTNGFFPCLESLCLEDLPVFMEIFRCQLPVGLFGELRNLKLHRLPALLHVCRSPTQSVSFSNLRSLHVSHCPKLRSLLSLSVAQDLMQLEEIKIEYCEMMEEIFSEERCDDGKISNRILFSKLNYLELDTLPNLTSFCKNARIEFPQLREMCIQSLQKLITFCPTASDLPFEGNDDNGLQFLFNEKIAFGSLKKLKITELDKETGFWCLQPSTSLFSELEVMIVVSCDTLRNLFSYSVAKFLVQLKHLIIEDCSMMQEVITKGGEIGQTTINESLLPQLKTLELRGLPILESFCCMINGLELPSLEDLILYDCPGMKKFSAGQVYMPMLKYVKRDLSVYRIDGTNHTVQSLFSEQNLFIHQSQPSSGQYLGAEVEELAEDDVMKGFIHSHAKPSNQATGGNRDAILQYDMNDKHSFCSPSRQSSITKEVSAHSSESNCLDLREERWDEDVPGGHSRVVTEANEGQKEEIGHEAKWEISIDKVLHDKRYVKDCILFCSVFPSDYQFTKDMLVWQWIAEGLTNLTEEEMEEEVCIQCFDILLNLDYIVASGYDHFVGQMMYKIGDKMIEFLQKQPLEPKFLKYLDSKQTHVAKIEHLSFAFMEIDHIKFGILKLCHQLQTLIIHGCFGSKVERLPSDLFLEIKALKILNLSRTNILELPSSVEYLEELRYLDMSETPIRWLPESIRCFSNLQTLKLDGCLSLIGLPKCTSKLINLRHLVLDVVRQLQSMPTGIGKLSKLQTLGAFLVGEDEGSRIGELKNMNKLKGSLRILNLENVMTREEAAEAGLCNKRDLKTIELQWSDLQDEKNTDEQEILESLQPPFGIHELKILFYSGGVLPSWISNPSFGELVSITLYRCRYCDSLPCLGELPSLKLLNIVENNEVVEINSLFSKKHANQHHVAFPKLEKLSFDSMSVLEKWTGLEISDFPNLRHLIIEYCPKFVGLPFLSHLNSLLHLEISCCPELSCLPEGGLPPTLESLMIKDCPKLKGRCCNEQCEGWSKVARVRAFYIDNQKVYL